MAAGAIAADLLVHVGADTKDAEAGLDQVGKKANNTGALMGKAGLALGGASLAIVGGLGQAINKAADFEQIMSNVGAVSGATDDQMQQLNALALKIGQDTAFSAAQGGQAIAELTKAGVPLTDVLNGAAMSAADLAEAGQVSIPQAATIMSNAMNMFQIAGSDSASVADSFAAAANASAIDVDQLAQAMAAGGAVAAGWGLSLNQTNTVLAAFGNLGLVGSDAGTSLKAMLGGLIPVTGDAQAALDGMGISAEDFANAADPMLYLTQKLTDGTKDMSDAQVQAALKTIFGTDGMRAALDLINTGPEKYSALTDAVNKQGVAQDIAKKNMDNLNGSMEALMGSIETVMIIVGSTFTPVLKKMANFINVVVNKFMNLPKPVQKITGIVIAATAGFLGIVAAIALVISYGGPVIAIISALAAPFLLIIGILALFYLAFSTNFLGIKDIMMGSVGAIIPLLSTLTSFLGMVSGGGDMTTASMAQIPAPLQNLAKALGIVVDAAMSFYNNIAGGHGISAAMDGFTKIITGSKMIGALSGIGGDLINAFKNIPWTTIGKTIWDGMLTALKSLYQLDVTVYSFIIGLGIKLGQWIWDEASSVDWGGILAKAAGAAGDITGDIVAKLGNLTLSIATWLWDKASTVPWGGILSGAASMAGDITGAIVGKLGNLTLSLATWLWDKASVVPWGGILSGAASMAGDITGDIVAKLGPLTTSLSSWLSSSSVAVDWMGGLTAGLGKITSLFAAIVPHLGDIAIEIKTWYDNKLNSVDWNNLGVIVGQKIHDLAPVLIRKVSEMVVGATKWLGDHWQDIGLAVLALLLAAPVVIGYIAKTLIPKAAEFLSGFLTGLGLSWPTIEGWLKAMPGLILTFYVGYLNLLKTAGVWLITGLWNGITEVWPKVSAWLSLVKDLAVGAVGNLLFMLWNAGWDLLTGLMNGAIAFLPTLVAVVKGAPTAVKTGLGDLSYVLWNAGWDLIVGLGRGIDAMKQTITDKAQGIVNAVIDIFKHIPGWSPIEHVGLYYGAKLGQGFADGLGSTAKNIFGEARGLTNSAISGLHSSIGSANNLSNAGSYQVVQHIQIDVRADDLDDIVQAGRFIQNLPTSRAAYMRGSES